MDQYEVTIKVGAQELFWGTVTVPGHSTAVNWATKAGKDLCAATGVKGGLLVKATLIPPAPAKTTLTDLVDASFEGYTPTPTTPPVIGPSSGPSPASGGPIGGVE